MTALGFSEVSVQNFGSARDVLIRLPVKAGLTSAALSEQVLKDLRQLDPSVELKRVEFVGPQVGRELMENGALALLFVSIGIVLYLWLRFEWKFGVAAIIANLHDVVIILGFFSIFQWEFSLPVLAAVLAVLGYSVNESVVVFDRVRENFRKMRKASVQTDNRQCDHAHDVPHHHHSRLYANDGDLDADFRRRDAALFRARADDRHLLRHIFIGAGRSPLVMWLGVSREDLVKPEKKAEIGAPI